MLLIHEPEEIIEVGSVKVLLYGHPGSRKTTFSMTAAKPILVDFDRGIRRVAATYRKQNVRPNSWADIIEFLNGGGFSEFQTVITDTVGASLDLLGEMLKQQNPKLRRSDGNLTQQGYGTLATTFRAAYLNPLEYMGKDLVFVAHHKEEKNGEETFSRPDITGQTLSTILRSMDLVGWVHVRDRRPCVTFTPTEMYFAKNSAGLPDFIFLDASTLEEIVQTFRDAVNADSMDYRNYLEQVKAFNDRIDAATLPEHLNSIVIQAKETTKQKGWIYSAKAEVGQYLKLKAETLGFTHDNEQGYSLPVQPAETSVEATETAQNETTEETETKPNEGLPVRPLSEALKEAHAAVDGASPDPATQPKKAALTTKKTPTV